MRFCFFFKLPSPPGPKSALEFLGYGYEVPDYDSAKVKSMAGFRNPTECKDLTENHLKIWKNPICTAEVNCEVYLKMWLALEANKHSPPFSCSSVVCSSDYFGHKIERTKYGIIVK